MYATYFTVFSFLVVYTQSAVEPNGTQTRTFYGYALGKLYVPVRKLSQDFPQNTFKISLNLPSEPIVTLPSDSTPNQQPFPHEVIPPQLTPTPSPSNRNLGGDSDVLRPLPPADAEPVPPNVLGQTPDTIRPLTISPDTVDFPSFPSEPSPFPPLPPGVPDLSSGLVVVRQPASSLAQNFPPFPQTIPLPQPGNQNPPANGLSQCSCVVAGTCLTRTLGGVVDVRVITQNPGGSCPVGQQYCCTSNTNTPAQPQQDSCGLPNIVPGVFPTAGQANFGEYPWSGIIYTAATQYIGGATLITNTHLLTAAHLVAAYGNGASLKVRLGEWDITGTYEPIPFAEYPVANIVIHPLYTATTLQNDLAVITLASPTTLLAAPTPQVNTACLPAPTDIFTGFRCFVAGWGRESWGGNSVNIIKKVDLTVVGSFDCQNRLRTTKLGPNYSLDTNSFICAGGEVSKDACQGDGGNALVCATNGNRFVVAGITAGGVECGHANIPGLYVNTANYVDWIRQQTFVLPPPPVGNIDPRRGNFN